MNDKTTDLLKTLGIIIAIFIVISVIDIIIDSHVWNNGNHTCGGNWTYQQAVGHRSSTHYLYECDECATMHEFLIKR